MTDHEKYQQAFSPIKPTAEFLDQLTQTTGQKRRISCHRCAAAAAVLALVMVCTTTAYAVNLFSFRQTINLWIEGVMTKATAEFNGDGEYRLEYRNENGQQDVLCGGAEAEDIHGNRRPLTQEELLRGLNAPKVEMKSDGSVWVYWQDQSKDITDLFSDGYAYVKLTHEGETIYLTVDENGGYVLNDKAFLMPGNWKVLP